MRKALLPMIASLALCGAATGALIATNARADQSGRKPMMVAVQGGLPGGDASAPEGGPQSDMMRDRGVRRAQFCKDMYASKVGELAFLEAKLSLTSGQQQLFDHWKQASLDIARQRQNDCTGRETRRPGERPGMVERLDMEETMLKKRLANIDAERPSLTAFYNSLNPQQKQEFTRSTMHGMEGGMHMMMGMMGPHPGMGGRMGHGPMGGPPGPIGSGTMGPGPMGNAPPPPPAQ